MTFTEIKNDIYFLTGANTGSYPIADLTANVNRAYDKVASLIMRSDGRWQWSDTNNTEYDIGSTDLNDGQQDYPLDVDYLKIHRVEILTPDGSKVKLIPFDQRDLQDESLGGFLDGGGTPKYYDKQADALFLYPEPNYDSTGGLTVWTQRGPSYFITTDTSKSPGFNSLYHRYLSLAASYDYAMKNGLKNRDIIRGEMAVIEEDLKEDYSMRDKDEHITLSALTRNRQFN